MANARVLIEDGDVEAFIRKNDLVDDVNLLEEFVMLHEGTVEGLPTVLMVGTIDGKKRVLKTTLRLFLTAGQAMNGAAERELGPGWRGP